MSRILLLCFVHGFKGDDDSFGTFPETLKKTVGDQLSGHRVESVIYPKYATKGELAQATVTFVEWLKERVMELRKVHLEKPWPPSDRSVGVILVAHSMGGFVASDALFHILNDRAANKQTSQPMFPLIQGILAFDTPYNGLARSMFVYGAFSNYQKVSSVFNVMTALSAAPASLSMAFKRGATSIPGSSRVSNPAAWKTWQLLAVRTGTVGAIAAGGVAAYVHRKKIIEGVQNMRSLKKEDVVEGYHQGVDRMGQGLAYINRGNMGQSFAWLSDHFTFVGVLMKQNELRKRLERLTALQGIGIHDFYCSLGENGYWTGGYFVPERTFSAIPLEDQPANNLFSRQVIKKAEDEIQAHVSMFMPDKNEEYQLMIEKASKLIITWFNDDSEIVDDPKLTAPEPSGSPENDVKATDEGVDVSKVEGVPDIPNAEKADDDGEVPDESPLDIAAAASLAPLPDDAGDAESALPEVKDKQTYMRYLMGVAQQAGTGIGQAGTGIKGYIPSKIPTVPSMPKPSMPNVSMPNVSMPSVSMPSVSIPSVSLFGRKHASNASEATTETKTDDESKEISTDAGIEQETKAPETAAEPRGGDAEPVMAEKQPETVVDK